jgi:hypothetical protein
MPWGSYYTLRTRAEARQLLKLVQRFDGIDRIVNLPPKTKAEARRYFLDFGDWGYFLPQFFINLDGSEIE